MVQKLQKAQSGDEPKYDAIVLLSGGIDSTTALWLAHRDVGKRVLGLSIFYGQRHRREIAAATEVCNLLGVEHRIKTLELPLSMLTDPNVEIPNASYGDLPQGISPTYVPFRNGSLLASAAADAQHFDAKFIYFGAHAEDAARWAYPDCTPEFIGAMANAIFIGTYQQTRLVTPFQFNTKAEIISIGIQYGVSYKHTWSCYKGGDVHCGVCPTCRARKAAFITAGVPDPTVYVE